MYLLSAKGHTDSVSMVTALKYLWSGWTDKTWTNKTTNQGSIRQVSRTGWKFEIQRGKNTG